MAKKFGYTDDLFILAFDHRGSFQKKMFGINGTPTAEQTREISSYKKIIYDGFKMAVEQGVPKDKAGILVDEQFGLEIIEDAKKHGYMVANPAEKSGQDEFDFEYGSNFGAKIEAMKPTFVKVLVRMNPEGDQEMNDRQTERLKKLGEFCKTQESKYLFELLVPATPEQLSKVGGNTDRFDKELRPGLMAVAMDMLQKGGVEPDLWKIEGIDSEDACKKIVSQARMGGRDDAGIVVLGRGADDSKVKSWLATAARVPGYNGFAVGRTIFWEPLKGVREGQWSNNDAAKKVRDNYMNFVKVWTENKA